MSLRFDPVRLPERCQALRHEVRAFLDAEVRRGTFDPDRHGVGVEAERAFALRVAQQGWIGMTWPRAYGGQERSFLDRYVVTEEMRVVNAPTRRFFVADRQSGPTLIRYASEEIKREVLPLIVRGECTFCIGMSEPDSGSDLFAAKAKATPAEGGWRLNGTKIWTSYADHADFMIGLFRTAPATAADRRHGLTSFLVRMSTPGIVCHPIRQMTGGEDFCEVVFDDVFVPAINVIGEVDLAWKQATSELAYERSGPERFLETYRALPALLDALEHPADRPTQAAVGRLVAQLHTLRRMSVSVAGMLEAGEEPMVEAAIVKDLGTAWEQSLPQRVRDVSAFVDPQASASVALREIVDRQLKFSPKLTIQGGTTEILRGIIARGLGLR